MQDNRREFSNNEKMLLFNEVGGRCPNCGDIITHKKNNKIHKTFEVAHIYPANPRQDEITLLENESRLSENVNDLTNVIAVCRKCHKIFDTPRTIREYQKWYRLKKRLLQDSEIKNTYQLFNIESEIRMVLEKLNDPDTEYSLMPLNYESLKIDEKTNETLPYILKRTIRNDVVDYFDFIKEQFLEIDKVTPYKFETLASQVKGFYYKCMQINQIQDYIYNALVDWIYEKTDRYSRRASEILVAFFIQDCEVFS